MRGPSDCEGALASRASQADMRSSLDKAIEALPPQLQAHARLWHLGCPQTLMIFWPFAMGSARQRASSLPESCAMYTAR